MKDLIEVVAGEAIVHPVPNEQKIKDTAGNTPDFISKHFAPKDVFNVTPDEYVAMKKAGVKVSCKDPQDEPENTAPAQVDISNVHNVDEQS